MINFDSYLVEAFYFDWASSWPLVPPIYFQADQMTRSLALSIPKFLKTCSPHSFEQRYCPLELSDSTSCTLTGLIRLLGMNQLMQAEPVRHFCHFCYSYCNHVHVNICN